ncbi:hypothetical protein NX059_002177 [Plenodomus lindquistii]|nr:hypothetical protein NX059_002177 [Plenodomus lindquistii]
MNPEGQMRLSDSVKLYGICTDMCPEFERVRRIVEEDVKAPECTIETEHLPRKERIPDESRMVKAYSRSAAGAKQELVSDIRSPATCLKTITYLYERLDHDSFDFLHSWLWDRTRAIRKDLRTQRIESKTDINILLTCLERSARFLLLSAHQMARTTKGDYSHQQDIEQLNQTLMSLKERYIDNRRANIPSENEAEFWAYRLILAPIYTNSQLENELHRVPSDIRNNPRVKVAIEIFRALKSILITSSKSIVQCQSNWKHFWDLIKSSRVSYLMACAAEISFNRMRHVVLDSIWRSYRQGTSKVPKSVEGWTPSRLKEALGLDTDSEAVNHCEAYGFIFERAQDGHTYLDFTRKGYQNHVLGMPSVDAELKPQIFSDSIVESKRYARALSAVIQGMSVAQARTKGLILDVDGDLLAEEEMEDETTSLFVPEVTEASTTNSNPFGHPASATAPSPFTFGQNTSTTLHSSPAPAMNGIQSGLFDASKNEIRFSTPGATGGSAPSSTPFGTPTGLGNPFLNGAGGSTVSAANPFASFHTQKTAGTATPAVPEVKPAFTSAGFNFQKAADTSAPATSEVNPPFSSAGFNFQKAAETATPATPEVKPAFTSAGFGFQDPQSQGTPQPAASFTPSAPLPQADTGTLDQESQADKDKREAAEKTQRDAELQRKQAEAKEAAQRAMRQKRAEAEAEQQRKQAEAVAQQQRAQQQREDQERRIKEERERRIREAQRRQALEEQARMQQLREQEAALHSLTMDVMFHPTEGLMMQFIENAAMNVAHEALEQVQKERNDAKGAELYRAYQLRLMRAGLAKIVTYVEKKRKMEQARERRRRLKAQRAQMGQMQEEAAVVNGKGGPVTAPKPTPKPTARESASQRPALAQSSRRAKRTEERRGLQQQNDSTNGVLAQSNGPRQNGSSSSAAQSNGSRHNAAPQRATSSMQENSKLTKGYSKAYQRSTAPIDRTETDYFTLRAMGLDPSKHRKRSFDSSSSGDEEPLRIEPKRAKLSPEGDSGQMPHPQPHQPRHEMSLVECQRAQLKAIQEKFRKSVSGEGASSVNGHASLGSSSGMTNGRVSRNRGESDVVARARRLVASVAGPAHASPIVSTKGNVTHDFGRSVPNLGLSLTIPTSTPTPTSAFRSSISTTGFDRPNAPAYWQRTSRFVPRECYGKGPEAVREYREKWGLNGSVSSASTPRPLSVEPAQQQQSQGLHLGSYVPETQTQGPEQTQEQFGFGYGFTAQNQAQQAYTFSTNNNKAHPDIDMSVPDDNLLHTEEVNEHWGTYDEQSAEEDADSEMYDEDDEEASVLDEEEEGEEEEEEEELQDYSEYSEDDEEDEEDVQPAQQPQQNGSSWGGATQDDAIELSD